MPSTTVIPSAITSAIPRSDRNCTRRQSRIRMVTTSVTEGLARVPRTGICGYERVELRRTMSSASSYSSTLLEGFTLTGKSTCSFASDEVDCAT